MKAEITATGTLVLTPETGTEAYALQRWSESAAVQQQDVQRAEKFHYRGSAMKIDLGAFPETMTALMRSDPHQRPVSMSQPFTRDKA